MKVVQDSTIYVDEKVVSKITGRARQTLANDRCKNQGIPFIKLGRMVRYSLADVHRYMQERRIETEPY
jgi:hypothetical protein